MSSSPASRKPPAGGGFLDIKGGEEMKETHL